MSGSDWDSRIRTGNEFRTLGVVNRKARDPNVILRWGTESWWELDERGDLVGSWCCKRSERYVGRPVCKALKVKVAGLNRIWHTSSPTEWCCLTSVYPDSLNTYLFVICFFFSLLFCWYLPVIPNRYSSLHDPYRKRIPVPACASFPSFCILLCSVLLLLLSFPSTR